MHMHNLLKSAWKWPNDAPWGTEENVKVVVHILFFFLFFFFYNLEPIWVFPLWTCGSLLNLSKLADFTG